MTCPPFGRCGRDARAPSVHYQTHSEEAGVESSRRDRRLGLDQGEDMAAADGAALQRRLGASASGARGSGRRRDSSPDARGSEREVEGAVMPPPAGGRPMDEQRGGALHREKRDKAQDGQGIQERRRDAERAWADAVGMEWSGRLGVVGSGRGVALRRRLGELRPPKLVPK